MQFDRGSAICIQVEFKKKVPFGALSYFDPTSPTITITNPIGTVVIDEGVLVKSAVGKYYYICQTAVGWESGVYEGLTSATDGSNGDITINEDLFRLK